MKRKRVSVEQIVAVLKQALKLRCSVDRENWIIFGNPVVKPFWKQQGLRPGLPVNESTYRRLQQ